MIQYLRTVVQPLAHYSFNTAHVLVRRDSCDGRNLKLINLSAKPQVPTLTSELWRLRGYAGHCLLGPTPLPADGPLTTSTAKYAFS